VDLFSCVFWVDGGNFNDPGNWLLNGSCGSASQRTRMSKYSKWGVVPPVCAMASLFLAQLCYAQTDSLALSSGTTGANGIASENLVLTSPAGSAPASIQFTLTYPAANVTSISVSAGPTAISAGKTVTCAAASGAYTCLVYGFLNATTIANGIVAVVNLTVTASVTIGISNPVAASPVGEAVLLSATGGVVPFQLALSQFALSVSPPSGAGVSQTFTFVYTDSNGASDLASAQAIFDASFSGVSSCYVLVTPGTGQISLASNTGAWPAPLTLGTAGTLQNSQCAVNAGSSSATMSGNTYTLNLAMSFLSGFSGSKNIYSLATDQAGANSGWQVVGTWNATAPGPVLQAVSVSPPSGAGPGQTFTFVYTDSNGASDLASAQAIFDASFSGVSSCYVLVTPGTGQIWLASNTGAWPAPLTLGTAGTLQNSQCAVNVGSSSATMSGNTYTLNLAMSFLSGFSGSKNIYSLATNQAGANSGWKVVGTWNATAPGPALQAVSVSPPSGAGVSQTFTFVYTDSNGASDLASAQAIFDASFSGVSSCYVLVTPGTGQISLASNTGTWQAALTLGTAGTLQNSQCAVNVGSSSATIAGHTYTLNLAMSFLSGFSGSKNIYSLATNQAGANSGWQVVGTWNATAPGPALQAVSVSPSSGAGPSQTFTFVYTDSNGVSDLASAQAIFNASFSGVSSCYVLVTPGTGQISLASDTGTWPAPMTLGTAGTLQNSQCAVNVGSSSGVLSGNAYTVNLAITFESGFAGAKNIYSLASSLAGLSSGWQTLGTWIP
jgi:hypothetical protein